MENGKTRVLHPLGIAYSMERSFGASRLQKLAMWLLSDPSIGMMLNSEETFIQRLRSQINIIAAFEIEYWNL